MRGGNLGGDYYDKIFNIQVSKLPTWVKLTMPSAITADWIYHKLMSLLL